MSLLIIVAFHVPVVIVPTVDRDDAEVKLPSVSIADSIVASVVASKASIFFNVATPLLSETTLDEPTVRLLPIVNPPVRDKSFLMVVVPVVAPIVTLVPAPAKLTVVAVVLIKLNVVSSVLIVPPFALSVLATLSTLPTLTLPAVDSKPDPIWNVPLPLIFIPSPLLNSKSPVLRI